MACLRRQVNGVDPVEPWEEELHIQHRDSPAAHSGLGVEQIGGWLNPAAAEDVALTGIYLQFEPAMLTPEGGAELAALAVTTTVGVWGHSEQGGPDDLETFNTLARCGVKYINTDLPTSFATTVAA